MGNAQPRKDSNANSNNSNIKITEEKKKIEPEIKVDPYANLSKKVGVAIIGIGARMTELLQHLLEKHSSLINLIGISDESKGAFESAKEILWMFEVMKTVPFYSDYSKLINKPEVDWVLIGSKNSLHRDHCITAFKSGKHVFCEKPLAISIQQCEDIRKAHKESGKLFATGFVLRYAPFYQTIRELVISGEIGKLVSVEANELLSPPHGSYIMRNWRRFRDQSGPHLLEKCCHDIDLLNWIVGSLPTRVASFGGLDIFIPENKPKEDDLNLYYNSWDIAWEKVDAFTSEKDIEDNQVCIIEYRNKVRATFHTNSNSGITQRKMTLCGVKGTIEADLITGKILLKRIKVNCPREIVDIGEKGIHGGADDRLVGELTECMWKGTKPLASGEEGFLSAITCLAIDEARREGKVVSLEPLWKQFEVDEEIKKRSIQEKKE